MSREEQLSRGDLNRKAAVAGSFYIAAQLLIRGMTFLITPIYTRMVSTGQYGELRVYESWLLILVPIASLSLYRSVERAKFDFPDSFEEFTSSALLMSWLSTAICFGVISLFFREAFMSLCDLNPLMYAYMILYIFGYTAILFFQRREKQLMRYQRSVRVTILTMLPATVLSMLLLYWGNRQGRLDDLVNLRIIGYYSPIILGGLIIAFAMLREGRFRFRKEHIKFALLFSLPLIPETISIQIMNQIDKIMVKSFTGPDNTGIFSLATTVSFITWIVEDSFWAAWQPWLYEKLSLGEEKDIQKPWDYISLLFALFSWGLVMLAPEIIGLLGGSKYQEAVWLVAPMINGTLFRFYSYSFSALENYQKKTRYCALGTFIAMVMNVVLNWICIHAFGYQAAAYTTALSYFVLMLLQGLLEKRVCGSRVVSLARSVVLSLITFAICLSSIPLYRAEPWIRWILCLVVVALSLWRLFPWLRTMKAMLKK